MAFGTLDEIHIYPVKSCRRVALESATVTSTGLAGDRMWQIVDEGGNPVTQREHRVLAAVQPELIEGGLRLSAHGHGWIDLADPTTNDVTVTSMLGRPVESADAGEDVARWISDLLGAPFRLAGITKTTQHQLPVEVFPAGQPITFVDAAPVLLANKASLRWLQARASEPFDMTRFRPNLTINAAEAWVEDTWSTCKIGDTQVTGLIPWPRCSVPQIDQETTDRHNEPARVLKAHRWCADASELGEPLRSYFEGSALFGAGCVVGPIGSVMSIGDSVEAGTLREPMLAAPSE